MSTVTNYTLQFTKSNHNKLNGNIIKKFMLLFFAMTFGSGVFAQRPVCASMGTTAAVSCFDQSMTFTVNLNDYSAGQSLTWTITTDNVNNNVGAFFVTSGNRTVHTTAIAGTNSIIVNAGHFPGFFTVKLKFDNYPEIGTCSSSLKVSSNCGQ